MQVAYNALIHSAAVILSFLHGSTVSKLRTCMHKQGYYWAMHCNSKCYKWAGCLGYSSSSGGDIGLMG